MEDLRQKEALQINIRPASNLPSAVTSIHWKVLYPEVPSKIDIVWGLENQAGNHMNLGLMNLRTVTMDKVYLAQ